MICRYDSTRMPSSPAMATEIGRASPTAADPANTRTRRISSVAPTVEIGVGGEHGQRDPLGDALVGQLVGPQGRPSRTRLAR